jgi:hypothetical protein
MADEKSVGTCEHCGSNKVYSYRLGCLGCGAPICCVVCCSHDNEIRAKDALIAKLRADHVDLIRANAELATLSTDSVALIASLRQELSRAHALLIPMVDIGQRRLNGGPYCVHVEGDGFCGRAKAWAGHSDTPEDWPGHPFVDGEWLAQLAIDEQTRGK